MDEEYERTILEEYVEKFEFDPETQFITETRLAYGNKCANNYDDLEQLFTEFVVPLSKAHFKGIKNQFGKSIYKKIKHNLQNSQKTVEGTENGVQRFEIKEREKYISVRCTEERCKFEIRFIKCNFVDGTERIRHDVSVRKFHSGCYH